ncbi:MAG TPA: hypothetical protein VMF30_17295, partial [Pirellulales bacterium]|nr:hypothetical protein [Pirellulales bacterium]
PIVALAIDRALFWTQCQLFPSQYGGAGLLRQFVRALFHGWEDVRGLVIKPAVYARSLPNAGASPTGKQS